MASSSRSLPPLLVMPGSSSSSSTSVRHRNRTHSFLTDVILFVGGALAALIVFWLIASYVESHPIYLSKLRKNYDLSCASSEKQHHAEPRMDDDPQSPTFYDDPELSYSIEKPVHKWDEKRGTWLKQHPGYGAGRVLMVSGSQPGPCRNPMGDHMLLKFFKNKVDYCRINGYELFYNNALFHPKMGTFWAKIPLVRAAMIAHPEAEWIWWVDSDAAFTDMEFKLPIHKYREHNLVVNGWAHLIYEKQSWVSLNAGVFLIRNCQWSMDFMDVWAAMGPFKPEYEEWSKTLKSTFKDKVFPESDDQSALVYLLLKEKEKWADKIFLENEYYFSGYWVEIVGRLDNISDKYIGIEKKVHRLRRRHAEKVRGYYGALKEKYLESEGARSGKEGWRRPFITHFVGCQPCSGDPNHLYSRNTCFQGMERALNFADNQVLPTFGFMHQHLHNSSLLPLPFDFPSSSS